MAASPNPRASLLAGLRTGGVRSASSPLTNPPHTAAPAGAFITPRIISSSYDPIPDEESDYLGDLLSVNQAYARPAPVTAAVDGHANRFLQQQQQQQQQPSSQRGLNVNSAPFSPTFMRAMPSPDVQAQALQMQLMQMEILRLQTIQAQQYQAELLAQASQQVQQMQNRRKSSSFLPPSSAGPLTTSFGDMRSATANSQLRRTTNQVDHLKSVSGDDHPPMTAALGGKFGSRSTSLNVLGTPSRFAADGDDLAPSSIPPTPSHTTVISGGTSLGNPSTNVNSVPPSKSDAASSWRRGGNNNSVLSGNRVTAMSPSVKITPPPTEPSALSPLSATKQRPQPLRFSPIAQQPMSVVLLDSDSTEVADEDASSTASSKSGGSRRSNSSPTTPHSASSCEVPLSPREEASKKLYEGLGIGRPSPPALSGSPPAQLQAVSHRMASQPTRQPRGPPSGADELGPKNFATRIRRKAIGGLGVLMGARERREVVEAY